MTLKLVLTAFPLGMTLRIKGTDTVENKLASLLAVPLEKTLIGFPHFSGRQVVGSLTSASSLQRFDRFLVMW